MLHSPILSQHSRTATCLSYIIVVLFSSVESNIYYVLNSAEAEFLDVIGTKALGVGCLYSTVHSTAHWNGTHSHSISKSMGQKRVLSFHSILRAKQEWRYLLLSVAVVNIKPLYRVNWTLPLKRHTKSFHFQVQGVEKELFPFVLSYEPSKRDVVLLLRVAVINIKPFM
jgi:hypothetical protein